MLFVLVAFALKYVVIISKFILFVVVFCCYILLLHLLLLYFVVVTFCFFARSEFDDVGMRVSAVRVYSSYRDLKLIITVSAVRVCCTSVCVCHLNVMEPNKRNPR